MRVATERRPHGIIGGRRIHVEEVTSTNDLALLLAAKGAPEGWVVSAERQTRGRGRQGKSWESAPGGLWTSVILRPSSPASEAVLFTLIGTLAAAEAIQLCTDLRPQVHWPNDLFLQGKKLGGVLCEMRGVEGRIAFLVMGIGINVNQGREDFPEWLRDSATSLYMETGRTWDREVLARSLYRRLDCWYRLLEKGEGERIWCSLEDWRGGQEEGWAALRESLRKC